MIDFNRPAFTGFREVFKKYYGVSPSKYGESEKTGSSPVVNLPSKTD